MGKLFRATSTGIVKSEKVAIVCATSVHLMPLCTVESTGLSNTPKLLKNRTTTIPKNMGQTGRVSVHGPVSE